MADVQHKKMTVSQCETEAWIYSMIQIFATLPIMLVTFPWVGPLLGLINLFLLSLPFYFTVRGWILEKTVMIFNLEQA